MARPKKSTDKKKLQGNPGKRKEEKPTEVDGLNLGIVPKLEGKELFYWNVWAKDLASTGKLNNMTLPDFLSFIKMRARLDSINDFLETENTSLIQESVNVTANGIEHITLKESAYAKMSRDLTTLVGKMAKEWGLSGGSNKFVAKPNKNPMDDFLNGK